MSVSMGLIINIGRSIQDRAASVAKKIGEKLTPEIKNCLNNALTMEEVEEVVRLFLLIVLLIIINVAQALISGFFICNSI